VNVLVRYIVIEILKGSFAALVVLWALTSLFTLADELKDLGTGNYGLKQVFLYVALMMPQYIYELMPSAALLGSLFVMGGMGNHRELIAMRVSGMSVMQIIKAVILTGLILVAISILIGEFIAPEAERNARVMRNKAQHEQLVMRSLYGLWLRDGNKFINVKQVLEEGKLADVSVYELDEDRRLRMVSHIERADYLGNEKWHLRAIKQTEISSRQIFADEFSESDWQSSIDPGLLDIVVVDPENLSLIDLATYIEFLQKNNQKSQKFELAFWGRLINPLISIVMLLVSVPFVIGIQRGVSVGARMLIGVFIGLSFNILDNITGRMGLVYDLNPAVMAVLPSFLVLSIAIYSISRIR
jgi:lipopolysaccharide export system permease protein